MLIFPLEKRTSEDTESYVMYPSRDIIVPRSVRDGSITRSLKIWVLTKLLASQLRCLVNFYESITATLAERASPPDLCLGFEASTSVEQDPQEADVAVSRGKVGWRPIFLPWEIAGWWSNLISVRINTV